MRYMRKTPVEAIQWTGHNKLEIHEFITNVAQYCLLKDDGLGNLYIFYIDLKERKFKTEIPMLGWIVREGNTLQFYKDTTFRETFDEVPDDEHKEITDTIVKDCEYHPNKVLKDISDVIEKRHLMFCKYNDLFKDDEKTREEIKKNLSNGLKEMEDSDKAKGTESDTFESVLDEMKELHAKKDKDYSGSFHNLFKEYGMSYALGHIEEKLNRVKAIIANGGNAVKNEHIEDSLIDGACYAVMLYVELKNKKNG